MSKVEKCEQSKKESKIFCIFPEGEKTFSEAIKNSFEEYLKENLQ